MTHSDRDGSENAARELGKIAAQIAGFAAPAGLPLHESADRDADNVPSDVECSCAMTESSMRSCEVHGEKSSEETLAVWEAKQRGDNGPSDRVEQWCEVMHDAYERAAVGAGWETNPASRKPWAEVPEANKATMRAAARAVVAVADREQAELRAENERLRALRCADCATGEPHACATLVLGEVSAERDHWRTAALNAESHKATLQDHVERAEATLARVAALHVPCSEHPTCADSDNFCHECGHDWPCSTVDTLRGPEPTEATSNEDAPRLDVGADAPTPVGAETTDAP